MPPILRGTLVRLNPTVARRLDRHQGHRARERRAAIAFALHPTRMAQLMVVADAGKLMPPKSTWFEAKLADGLLSDVLD